jgi:hypothetical protein
MNITSNNIKKLSSVPAVHTYYKVEQDNKTYIAIDVQYKNLNYVSERKIFHTDGSKITINNIDLPIPTQEIKSMEDSYSILFNKISDLIKTLDNK